MTKAIERLGAIAAVSLGFFTVSLLLSSLALSQTLAGPGWAQSQFASITTNPSEVISGAYSLKLSNPTPNGGFVFGTDPGAIKFTAAKSYSVSAKYKILTTLSDSLSLSFYSEAAGNAGNFLPSQFLRGKVGDSGTITYSFTLGNYNDYRLNFNFNGTGVVVIDDIIVTQTDTGAVIVSANMEPTPETIVTPQSGWWWNPNEPGRGFMIEQQGGNIFLAAYLYDQSGRSSWYAAGPLQVAHSTFIAPIASFGGGQTLTGPYVAPSVVNADNGTIAIVFWDPSHGVVTWPGGTFLIQRYEFASAGLSTANPAGSPQTGWWWNPNEGGRGFSFEIQNGQMFMGGYMYDATGNPVWYISGPAPMTSPTQYQGTLLQYGFGQTLTGQFQTARVANPNAGAVAVRFTDPANAVMTLPDGRSIPLTRFLYGSSPAPRDGGVATIQAQYVASLPYNFQNNGDSTFSFRHGTVIDLLGKGYPQAILTFETYPNQNPHPIAVVDAQNGISFIESSIFANGILTSQGSNNIWFRDINGDGLPDLVLSNAGLDHPPFTGGPIAVALNQGNGTFRNVSSLLPGDLSIGKNYSVAVGDAYGDGGTEIILPDVLGGVYNAALKWNGSGFAVNRNWIDQSIWVGYGNLSDLSWLGLQDFDGDGIQDLLVAGIAASPSLRMVYGAKSGFLARNLLQLPQGPWGNMTRIGSPVSAAYPISSGGNVDRVVIADFNNDGLPDIFTLDERKFTFIKNAYGGPNYPGTTIPTPTADQPDLVNIFADYSLHVLINQGGRAFRNYSQASPARALGPRYYTSAWAMDLNNDGLLDVVATYYTKAAGSVLGGAYGTTFFLNDGTGAFQAIDGADLFPDLLSQNGSGQLNLGSLMPTMVSRSGMEAVVVQAPNASATSMLIAKAVMNRSIGTGPRLVDGAALGAPGFNEFFYLNRYPSVASAVAVGTYTSGLDHYVKSGRAAGYQAFAQSATLWGGSAGAPVTLYGNNTYHGGGGNDTITSTGANNVIGAGGGTNVVNAGTSTPLIYFNGPSARYTFSRSSGSITVTDTLPTGDGSYTINGSARMRFSDQTIQAGN